MLSSSEGSDLFIHPRLHPRSTNPHTRDIYILSFSSSYYLLIPSSLPPSPQLSTTLTHLLSLSPPPTTTSSSSSSSLDRCYRAKCHLDKTPGCHFFSSRPGGEVKRADRSGSRSPKCCDLDQSSERHMMFRLFRMLLCYYCSCQSGLVELQWSDIQ